MLPPLVLLLFVLVVRLVAEPTAATSRHVDMQPLLSTVDVLNGDLGAETNVLIEFTGAASEEFDALTQHVLVPKLLVRTSAGGAVEAARQSLVIQSHFRSKLLSVVLLRGDEPLPHVLNVLRSVLWLLHHSNVLFVETTGGRLPLESVFEECWQNGFTNVLALSGGRHYTYHRFPQLRVVELPSLRAYYSQLHLRNWHGHQLRSTVLFNAPRSYPYVDRVTGRQRCGGYLYHLVVDFARRFNATFVRTFIGANHSNLELAGRAFERRQLDIMTTILYIHPGYSRSLVLAILHVYVVVPHARPINNYLYFVKPLRRWGWTLVAVVSVVVLVVLAVIYRVQHSDADVGVGLRIGVDWSAALLHTLTILLYLPHRPRALRTYAQCCFIVLILCSGFLINIYTSSLSSMLTSKLYEPQIDHYYDIDRTQLLLPKPELDIAIWSNLSSMSRIIKDRLRTVTPKFAYELLLNLSTEHLLADVEDRLEFFMYQQKFLKEPRVKKLDRVLHTFPWFVPFPHNSPFLPLFDVYLRRCFESGLYGRFVQLANDEGIKNGEIAFFEEHYTPFMQLGMHHLDVVFVGLWAFGLLLATIAFAMELIYVRYFMR